MRLRAAKNQDPRPSVPPSVWEKPRTFTLKRSCASLQIHESSDLLAANYQLIILCVRQTFPFLLYAPTWAKIK